VEALKHWTKEQVNNWRNIVGGEDCFHRQQYFQY
jgi:hypothetical protein